MSYLVRGQFVLTMSDRLGVGGIVEDGAVYISGKQIAEIGVWPPTCSGFRVPVKAWCR
ncbi:MAG TPA: hypothetical protein VLJ79_11365 [Candidatus Binatia bacterium]|nr:hypothetical protein [Candidatus Binatia bacterium]